MTSELIDYTDLSDLNENLKEKKIKPFDKKILKDDIEEEKIYVHRKDKDDLIVSLHNWYLFEKGQYAYRYKYGTTDVIHVICDFCSRNISNTTCINNEDTDICSDCLVKLKLELQTINKKINILNNIPLNKELSEYYYSYKTKKETQIEFKDVLDIMKYVTNTPDKLKLQSKNLSKTRLMFSNMFSHMNTYDKKLDNINPNKNTDDNTFTIGIYEKENNPEDKPVDDVPYNKLYSNGEYDDSDYMTDDSSYTDYSEDGELYLNYNPDEDNPYVETTNIDNNQFLEEMINGK